jgi:hypothetical protein
MRVIALEEHFAAPAIAGRIDRDLINRRGYRPRRTAPNEPSPQELLPELGADRLRLMDESGITLQVLSNSGPGPDLVPGSEGVALARAMNDHLAEAVARHPDRFAGFAVLPMQSPDAAAQEFSRAVKELGFFGALINGTTEDASSITPVTTAFWPRPKHWMCRSISTRIWHRTPCGRHIIPGSNQARDESWKPRVGVGIRKPRYMFCAWYCPARWIATRN